LDSGAIGLVMCLKFVRKNLLNILWKSIFITRSIEREHRLI